VPRVTFHPSGVTVEVAEGTSLFDAGARTADIKIETACVGRARVACAG
jgi:hypothetical protein